MTTEQTLKELEKARLKSKKAIPIDAVSLVVVALVLWIIARFVSVPYWITIIVLGLIVFTLIGDIINYAYCGLKLKMDHKKAP